MDEQLLAAALIVIVSAPLFVIGWYFRSGRAKHLLVGVNPSKVKDPDGLAAFIGRGLMLLGALHVAFAVAVAVLPEQVLLVAALVLAALISALVIWMVLGMARFSSK